MTAELLDAAPGLRAISNYAVGVDNIDLEAATARGIPVGHTPDVLTETTADLPSRSCSAPPAAWWRATRWCAAASG